MFSKIGLTILLVAQIVCFTLLWNKKEIQPEYLSIPVSEATVPGTPVTATMTRQAIESLLRDAVKMALKQEMSAYNQATQSAASNMEKEKSPANLQAFNEASAIVNNAISQGIWTHDDAMAFRQKNQELTMEQQKKNMLALNIAINNQQVKLEGGIRP
jgi:hypothetical protein